MERNAYLRAETEKKYGASLAMDRRVSKYLDALRPVNQYGYIRAKRQKKNTEHHWRWTEIVRLEVRRKKNTGPHWRWRGRRRPT